MQLHRDAEKTLQKSVMQFLGNACSFGKPFLESNVKQLSQLMHSYSVYRQCRQPGTEYAAQAKPPSLPQCRLNFEPDLSSRPTPKPVAVTGIHSEAVCAWAKVTVCGLKVRDGFTPLAIKAVQLVTVSNPLRIG